MVNTVLCVGQPENPHVQEVVKEIKALDSEAKVVIFNHLAGDSNFIELSGGNLPEPGCVLIANGERIPGDSITSVWFYPKPNMPEDNQNVEGKTKSLLSEFLFIYIYFKFLLMVKLYIVYI